MKTMTQEQKNLLLKDLCVRLPYGVKASTKVGGNIKISLIGEDTVIGEDGDSYDISFITPYLFPLSSMTEEDYAIYSKIWEDSGKMAYLEGHHHLISTIKAYKAANDYLLSKYYDIDGLIPMELAIDATGLNIY